MFEVIFYLTAVIAVVAAGAVLLLHHPVHAALYLVVSLIAQALLFYLLGAPLLATVQIMIYAGAIMVLFLFVMMMIQPRLKQQGLIVFNRRLIVPGCLVVILGLELMFLFGKTSGQPGHAITSIGPKTVGIELFSTFMVGVEVVAITLLAALVAAIYLSKGRQP